MGGATAGSISFGTPTGFPVDGNVQYQSVPNDAVGTPGSLGPNGLFQPQAQQQPSHPMCGRGTYFDGNACVAAGPNVSF
jgi:hypothetical protein